DSTDDFTIQTADQQCSVNLRMRGRSDDAKARSLYQTLSPQDTLDGTSTLSRGSEQATPVVVTDRWDITVRQGEAADISVTGWDPNGGEEPYRFSVRCACNESDGDECQHGWIRINAADGDGASQPVFEQISIDASLGTLTVSNPTGI